MRRPEKPIVQRCRYRLCRKVFKAAKRRMYCSKSCVGKACKNYLKTKKPERQKTAAEVFEELKRIAEE